MLGQRLSVVCYPRNRKLKNEFQIRVLTHTLGKNRFCRVHAVPRDFQEIAAWMRELPQDLKIEYRGEGLAGITWKVLLQLLRRRERRYLGGEEKHALMEETDYRCAECNERCWPQWDHKVRLANKPWGEQETESFQPICVSCHEKQDKLGARRTRDRHPKFTFQPTRVEILRAIEPCTTACVQEGSNSRPRPSTHCRRQAVQTKCFVLLPLRNSSVFSPGRHQSL